MKIEIVQLENIRSHVKSTTPFARGFNCLVGGLGCGKSSILYAVDFALFGDSIGRSYDYLLREDANSGKVMVQFVQNGKSYRISRGLKRRGKGISQDLDELKLFEEENLIASMKNEAVIEQLKEITSLDKDVFREIVWVRQEHLKELLDTRPRDRQTRLDELFGLSDYETAWTNIAAYQRDYETEQRVYEKDPDVVGMGKLGAEYNRAVEELSVAELQLQDTERRLNEAKKVFEEADLKLKRLEEVRARVEELKQKEAQAHANLTNLEDTCASLAEKTTDKRSFVEGLKKRMTTLEAQLDSVKTELEGVGISSSQPLDALRKHLTMFDDQISTLKGEQQAASRGVRENQRRISSLSAENRCPICLQSLTEEYKEGLMQRIQGENDEWQKTMGQLQKDIEELQLLRSKANSALSNLQLLTPKVEELKARISEESEALSELSSEFEEKQKLEREMRSQLEGIRAEINRLDISEMEAARNRREQYFKQYYMLNSDFRARESGKKELIRRLSETKEHIDQAQQKIERIEKIARVIEIIEGVRDAYRSIQPMLRGEFVKVLRNFVQQVLDGLMGADDPLLNVLIDETYTPYVKSESSVERDVSNLSGGERTLLAFAYRIGLGQLIMQSRTGNGLSMLLLDEPTESLGSEDGSIERLAEAISRFKAIEQIIAVTHSEAFAEKAEHVIRLEKEAGESRISVEK